MNTNYKVGQRVKVISACTGTDLNVNGWTGEIMEVQSDNFVGIKFAEYPLLYCFSDDGITLNVEILEPTPKWLPIDRDNLPSGNVICKRYNVDEVFSGTLQIIENSITCIVQNNTFFVKEVTHYIPLSDLLNLPIAE